MSMIEALFGGGFEAAPRERAVPAYRTLQAGRELYEGRFDRQPQFAREESHFRENIGKVSGVEDLLKDRRLLEFSLKAFQLESEVNAQGLIRKLLSEDPEDPKALANRMVDPRYRQFAAAFADLRNDPQLTENAAFVDGIVDAWRTNSFEIWQGERNPAIREALYFKRMIGSVDSINGLLGNRVMSAVVRTALNLPDQFGALEVRQQRDYLSRRLDLEDFKDPKLLDRFIDRFLIASDMKTGAGAGGNEPMLALFTGINFRV